MDIARNWRLKAQRYRMQGTQCPVCQEKYFPPRPVCPSCLAVQAVEAEASLVVVMDKLPALSITPENGQ